MIQQRNTYPGYIMVMALLMISLAVMMTSVMFDRSSTYVPYMKAVIDRQKASAMALGGLALVQAQLSQAVVAEQKEGDQPGQKPKPPTPDQKMQHLLKIILPTLNRWQHFEMTEEQDGIDGTLSVCLMSEEGKINLNKVFDFEKKQFVGEPKAVDTVEPSTPPQAPRTQSRQPARGEQDWKKNLMIVFDRLEKETKTKELFKSLEEFLKKRDYPLNDITELLAIKNFAFFKNALYYEPPHLKMKKNKEEQRPYALTDLFTLHSDTPTIEPWLLSDSMLGVLGIPRAQAQDGKKRMDSVIEWIKNSKVQSNWQQDWDKMLSQVYGVEVKALAKDILALFGTMFKAHYFSVIVSCTIGDATQRLLAILERIEKSQDTKTVYDVKIKKFYWV